MKDMRNLKKDMRNLKKCVLRTVVTTAIFILTMGTAYSDEINLTPDGKVHGKPFEYLQQQIDSLQQQIDNLQQQIDNIPGSGPTRFTDMGNGTIQDNDTGLIWLKDASCIQLGRRLYWEEAKSKADTLANGLCGLTDESIAGDWRLPTKNEWEGFMSTVYENPALVNRAGDAKWYDGDAFIGVEFGPHQAYWSSDVHERSDEHYQYAWVAYLSDGTMGGLMSGSTWPVNLPMAWVWPVR